MESMIETVNLETLTKFKEMQSKLQISIDTEKQHLKLTQQLEQHLESLQTHNTHLEEEFSAYKLEQATRVIRKPIRKGKGGGTNSVISRRSSIGLESIGEINSENG